MDNSGILHFTLAEVKRMMNIKDNLNDDFLIYSFDGGVSPRDMNVHLYGPVRADVIGIAVLYDGKARVNINTRNYDVHENMALMLLPSSIYKVECSENARGFIFAVSSSMLRTDMNISFSSLVPIGLQMYNNPCFTFSESAGMVLGEYVELVRSLLQNANYDVNAMRGLLSSLFFFMNSIMEKYLNERKQKSDSGDNRNSRLMCEFIRLLTENFRTEHRIAFYADKLCLTPKYFSSLIKQTSGKSASDWIDGIIVSEAKLLLLYSDLSVQQIAYQLNFPTASFFGTYFKRHTGMTPGDFRNHKQ